MTDAGHAPLTPFEATAEVLEAQQARHPIALIVVVSGPEERGGKGGREGERGKKRGREGERGIFRRSRIEDR